MKARKNFTLIDLLVVIALLSVIVPSISYAKEAAKRASCLFSVTSLTTSWLLRIQDNKGLLMPDEAKAQDGWVYLIPGFGTNPQDAPLNLHIGALGKGLPFLYVNTYDIYRCSVAKKTEFRTFGLTDAFHGNPSVGSYGGDILVKFR